MKYKLIILSLILLLCSCSAKKDNSNTSENDISISKYNFEDKIPNELKGVFSNELDIFLLENNKNENINIELKVIKKDGSIIENLLTTDMTLNKKSTNYISIKSNESYLSLYLNSNEVKIDSTNILNNISPIKTSVLSEKTIIKNRLPIYFKTNDKNLIFSNIENLESLKQLDSEKVILVEIEIK